METVLDLAAHCGIEDLKQAELAVGGFIVVLRQSKNIVEADVDKIVALLQADEYVKEYEKVSKIKGAPKHVPIIMALTPKPGPPPVFVATTVISAIRRRRRDDKDAMHTQDCFNALTKKVYKIDAEVLEKFMGSFIAFIEATEGIDLSEILCLPEK